MLAPDYSSYSDLWENFSYGRAWEFVDGPREEMNVTEQCIDRHEGVAVRTVDTADGSIESFEFGDIADHAAQFAHFLDERGVEKGERVAIMLDPSMEFLASFFGAIKQGAVAVPCSELFGPDAIEYRLKDSEPPVLVSTGEVVESIDTGDVTTVIEKADLLSTIEENDIEYEATTTDEDDCWVQYTSGTTGHPTGITYQHKSIPYNTVVKDIVLDFQPSDSCFTTSSVGWGAGIWNGLFTPLLLGLPSSFYVGKFDADVILDGWETIDVNALLGIVPTALRKLVDAANERDTSPRLDKINYLGEPIDAGLSRDVEETFGAFPRSIYGATELRSNVTADFAVEGYALKHGSMGKPLPGIEVKVVDDDGEELPAGQVGRIMLRRSDEWLETGDAAYMDEDGYLWSAGRADDTIISAGYTIGPQEIEDTMRTHPAVDEVGVIGVPDDERGEIVKAFVTASQAVDDELTAELQDYVREELGKHEYPREIEFLDDIPQTPDGKIKRPTLREIEGIE